MKTVKTYSPRIKVLSLILSFLVIFYLVPVSVFAEGLNNGNAASSSYAPEADGNNDGLEGHNPTATHSAGDGGVGSINLATGKLTLAIPTLTTTDSLFAFTPTLVYNSSLAGKDVTSEHVDIPFATSYMPKGFKLNIQETIVEKEYCDENNVYHLYYSLYDADGTTHNFFSDDNTNYYDDSGLRLTLTFSNSDIEIEDTSKTVRTYSAISDTAWHLTSVTDRYGNQLIFEFNTSYQPTKVTVKPNGLSNVEILSFLYENDKLIAVYNDASKASVILNYSDGNLYMMKHCYGNDNTTEQDVRDAYNDLESAENVESYVSVLYLTNNSGEITGVRDLTTAEIIRYQTSNGKITNVTEYIGNTLGRKVSYTYGNGYTDVRSTGNDEILDTDDDIITRYIFDENNRAVSVYSMSADSSEIYSITTATYEDDNKIKNSLKERTVLQGVEPDDVIEGVPDSEYFATIDSDNTTGFYKQTVFLAENVASLTESNANMEYIISGFGYSNSILQNESSDFSLGVNVYYYQGEGMEDEVVSYSFDFADIESKWQYVCGRFSCNLGDSPTYKFVRKIEVVCSYYGHPDIENESAYANFKDVALTPFEASNGYNYYYYESGNLAIIENSFYREEYEYDTDNRLTLITNSYNEIAEYTYTEESGTTVRNEKCFIYDPENNARYLVSETVYTYNEYGLLTKTSALEIIDDNSASNDELLSITSEYEYITTAGSRVFGALISETDSLGNRTEYTIDPNKGWLLYAINTTTYIGYKYDYYEDGTLWYVTPVTMSGDVPVEMDGRVIYGYYANGELSYIWTESTEYHIRRDIYSNPYEIEVGDRTLATYEYYPNNGKLKKINYGNGFSEEYEYNTLEMLEKVWYTYDDGTREQALSYAYNPDGTLDVVSSLLEGKETKYEYDDEGRLTEIKEKDTDETDYTTSCLINYDSTDRVSCKTPIITYGSTTSTTSRLLLTSYEYGDNGALSVETHEYLGDNHKINYSYDSLNRISSIYRDMGDFDYTTEYTYLNGGSYGNGNNSSHLVSKYVSTVGSSSTTYLYGYDPRGNITTVETNGSGTYYTYDYLGQLVSEWDDELVRTYTYDEAGNIVSINTEPVTSDGGMIMRLIPPLTQNNTVTFSYTDSQWGDLLTSFNGTTITYDEIGNPLSYYNGTAYTFTWEGRKLVRAVKGSKNLTFVYNDEGIRTSKTVNGVKHTYHLNGSQIIAEEWGNKLLVYLYDASGSPIGMMYRTTSYEPEDFDVFWFEKNLQGDIIAVYNESGIKVATYTYSDAWGNHSVSYSNGGASTGVQYNPFRYRGYYYDTDLGMYYLQSRYYDSKICRFINADSYISTGQGLTGYNMFAYCGNNPVNRIDPTGEISNILIGITIGAFVGFVSSVISQLTDEESSSITPEEFWTHVGISVISGAISGGLAASGVGLKGQIVGNTIIGGISGLLNEHIKDVYRDDYSGSAGTYIMSGLDGAIMGGISGLIGGSGSASKHVSNSFWRMVASGGSNLSYYFSQISKQAMRDGIKAIPSIFKAAIPSVIDSLFSILNQ